MSYANWLAYLASAEKHSVIDGSRRKIFYKFLDGKEMAEEYNMETGVIQRRAWRKHRKLLNGEPEWEMEIGEAVQNIAKQRLISSENSGNSAVANEFILSESNTEPMMTKRITKKNIEWRIRNLPYPISVYQVTVDTISEGMQKKQAIVVRTVNKKYFKIIDVPEFSRCNLQLEQSELLVHHQYDTLIITYRKPQLLCEMEAETLVILKDVETESDISNLISGLFSK